MLQRLLPHNKKWLVLFLGLWLTAWQLVAAVHVSEQPLSHDSTHCLLCNFGNQQISGPVAMPTPVVSAVLVSIVAEIRYSQPTVATVRRHQARAPPAFS